MVEMSVVWMRVAAALYSIGLLHAILTVLRHRAQLFRVALGTFSAGVVNVDFADVRTVMQNGGSALMGTGVGRGENRALEGAQQAISSPLLDNISISGASGVLINITGGNDLTLGEVTQISEVIHDAVGEEAEVIFGAVTDAAMQGEIRVTVIATGFDRQEQKEKGVIQFPQRTASRASQGAQVAAAGGSSQSLAPQGTRRAVGGSAQPAPHPAPPVAEPLTDMEIPTFIRRQMD